MMMDSNVFCTAKTILLIFNRFTTKESILSPVNPPATEPNAMGIAMDPCILVFI